MAALSRRQLAVYAADSLLADRRVGSVAKELAAVLVNSRRANQAELLAQDIAWELERRGEAANATVTTAHELSEALCKQISDFVKKSARVKQVIINKNLDESVIGGARIDTAAHSWDKTLSRKLTEVREVL
jgi:F0F1-type ATP synthase delta subunit